MSASRKASRKWTCYFHQFSNFVPPKTFSNCCPSWPCDLAFRTMTCGRLEAIHSYLVPTQLLQNSFGQNLLTYVHANFKYKRLTDLEINVLGIGRVATSMYLEPPQFAEVFSLINSLGLRKSLGSDNIDAFFIRIACNIITSYLTQLVGYHLNLAFF